MAERRSSVGETSVRAGSAIDYREGKRNNRRRARLGEGVLSTDPFRARRLASAHISGNDETTIFLLTFRFLENRWPPKLAEEERSDGRVERRSVDDQRTLPLSISLTPFPLSYNNIPHSLPLSIRALSVPPTLASAERLSRRVAAATPGAPRQRRRKI